MPAFYTTAILLINQLGDFREKQLSVFGCFGLKRGPKLPLYARTSFAENTMQANSLLFYLPATMGVKGKKNLKVMLDIKLKEKKFRTFFAS